MAPEQIALVTGTLERLQPRLDEVAADLFRRLFAAHPELRATFPAEMAGHRRRFTAELRMIVAAIPDAFAERARRLGARHADYGVRAAHYPMLAEALIAALGAAMGPQGTIAHRQAWRTAYDLVSEAMLMGTHPVHVPAR